MEHLKNVGVYFTSSFVIIIHIVDIVQMIERRCKIHS